MKPLVAACICLLFVARTNAVQPGEVDYLPITSREVITTQIGHAVGFVGISLVLSSGEHYSRQFERTNSTESLETTLLTEMTNLFSVITKSDAGKTATFSYGIGTYAPTTLAGYIGFGWSGENNDPVQTNFTIAFDGQGKVVAPYHDLLYSTNSNSALYWSLAQWVPIPNAGVAVERIDYVLKSSTGKLSTNVSDHTGSDCHNFMALNDGTLYLQVDHLSLPDWARSTLQAYQVVRWYSVKRGIYDVIDVATGRVVRSTLVTLTKTAGGIALRGWPGSLATVETSTNLAAWTLAGTVTLDANGDGTFSPALTSGTPQQFFFRSRIAP